jgi:hypothetical protein
MANKKIEKKLAQASAVAQNSQAQVKSPAETPKNPLHINISTSQVY